MTTCKQATQLQLQCCQCLPTLMACCCRPSGTGGTSGRLQLHRRSSGCSSCRMARVAVLPRAAKCYACGTLPVGQLCRSCSNLCMYVIAGNHCMARTQGDMGVQAFVSSASVMLNLWMGLGEARPAGWSCWHQPPGLVYVVGNVLTCHTHAQNKLSCPPLQLSCHDHRAMIA